MRKPKQKFTFLPPIHGDQDLNTLMARIIDSFELEVKDAPAQETTASQNATEIQNNIENENRLNS